MPKTSKIEKQSELQDIVRLLDPQQYQLCQQIAEGNPPWSQRAKALMAINDGASETDASELSQLRTTQVKFWLDKFNQVGMDIFSEALRNDVQDLPVSSPENIGEELPISNESGDPKKLKKKKKDKGKKGKGKKKKNKGKKDKRKK